MGRRLIGCLTAVVLTLAGIVGVSTASAAATTAPIHALVGIARTALLNTATGVGAPRTRMAPHRWLTFAVPAGPLTASGHTIVLTVGTSSASASGAIGLVTSRTSTTPPSVLNYAAGRTGGTTVLRAASTARTLSIYNNSTGYVNVAVNAVGYTQPSPTEAFHATSRTILDTVAGVASPRRALARGVWLSPSVVGGTVPTNVTMVLTQFTATGGTAGGSVAVLPSRPATAPTAGPLAYAAGGSSVGPFISALGSVKALYVYNTGSAPVNLSAHVIGYVSPVPPPATTVTGLTATSPSKGVVHLTWVNPPGTTSVVVRRSSSTTAPATPTSDSGVPLTSTTSATDSTSGLFLGPATYSVFVQSPAGLSMASIGRPGPQPPTPTPAAWGYPIGPGCNPSPGEVLYTWNQTGPVDHYVVGLSPKGGGVMFSPGGGTPTGTTLPGTARSYKATGLEGRGEYGLTIYAFDSVGNFSTDTYIDCIAGTGSDQVPAPVGSVTGSATPSSVTLNWADAPDQAISGVTYNGFVAISRAEGTAGPSTPNGSVVIVSRSAPQSSTITDPTVLAGHTYTYSIWSMNESWVYGTPVSYTISVPAGAPPGPVTGLTATALPQSPTNIGESIHLTWTAPASAPGAYVVARALGTAAKPDPVPPTSVYAGGAYRLAGSTTAFTDPGLPKNTTVAYSVWALGADGSYSPVATASATTDPGLPRTVSGHIVNSATHAAIGQASTITFTPDPSSKATPITASTDATGAFSVQLPVAVYQACVDDKTLTSGSTYGYFRTCTSETVGPTTSSLDVPVDPKGAVTGTVTDSHGQPVAGATISMPDPKGIQVGPYYPVLTATTDSAGHYALAGATAGSTPTVGIASPSINGTSEYTTPSPAATQPIPAGGTVVENFSLTAIPTITISGTVTNALTNATAPGVKLYFLRGPNGYSTATTGADGSYSETFAVNSGDSVQVCADAEGTTLGLSNQCVGGADYDPPSTNNFSGTVYGTATAISTTQTANLALQPESTITGQVVGSGNVGIAGVNVTAWMTNRADRMRISATTDPSGTYVIHTPLAADMTNLKPQICVHVGTVTDAASPAGYTDTSPCTPAVNVSPLIPTATASTITVPFAAGVTGLVTANGAPAAGVTVTLNDKVTHTYDSYPQYTAVTDATGRYTITDMDPGGYQISLSAGGYTSPTGVSFGGVDYPGPTPTNLTLSAGQLTNAADMPLTPNGTITGTVTAADTGHPLVGVTVHGGSQTAVTDAAGQYAFHNAVPGYQAVTADAVTSGPGTGYQTTQVDGTVTAGGTTAFNITMPVGAEVDIHVITPDGAPLQGVGMTSWGATFTAQASLSDASGYIRNRGLPPHAGDTACTDVGIRLPGQLGLFNGTCVPTGSYPPGHVTTVTMVSGYGGQIVASVHDATTGQPITGASVTYYAVGSSPPASNQTTVNGTTWPYLAVNTTPAADTQFPEAITPVQFRVCAQAPGYAAACAADDASDGTSGTAFSAYPDMTTLASIALTPN